MAARKQFQSSIKASDDLKALLEKARSEGVTEEQLQEQRISFAFGNAPESDRITKASVRLASKRIRLTNE